MRMIDADTLSEELRGCFQDGHIDSECDLAWEEGFNDGLRCALRQIEDAGEVVSQPNDPLTMEELERMDGQPVWIDNGRGENKCYIVNNEYEVHGTVEPCGIDLWGAGTSLSLLVRCGLYREPPNREESA